jgi:hypothetical protein
MAVKCQHVPIDFGMRLLTSGTVWQRFQCDRLPRPELDDWMKTERFATLKKRFLKSSERTHHVARLEIRVIGFPEADDLGHRSSSGLSVAGEKSELDICNCDNVAVGERGLFDTLAVNKSAIGAVEIANAEGVAGAHDGGMFARDTRGIDWQISGVVPSD